MRNISNEIFISDIEIISVKAISPRLVNLHLDSLVITVTHEDLEHIQEAINNFSKQ